MAGPVSVSNRHHQHDIDDEGIKALAEGSNPQLCGRLLWRRLAPLWRLSNGSDEERKGFLRRSRRLPNRPAPAELGVRPYGVVRIDSACGVSEWAQDAETNQRRLVQTFSEACDELRAWRERLAGREICWAACTVGKNGGSAGAG